MSWHSVEAPDDLERESSNLNPRLSFFPPPSNNNRVNPILMMWSWATDLVGAATAAINSVRPKDPTFELLSITLNSLKPNLPAIDAELILTVRVTNPNIVPIHYSATEMSIFYDGSLLGTARIEAGSQPPRSERTLRLPARLAGLELGRHAAKFVADVARREMVLEARTDIEGAAVICWWWEHRFRVHVDSHVVVDPVFLDVVDQDNKADMELFVA